MKHPSTTCLMLLLASNYVLASDWSEPSITDTGAMVYSETSETTGTGTFLSYVCSTEQDWCSPALLVLRPCTQGVVTPAFATVTGGALDPEDQGTFFVNLTCISSTSSSSEHSLLRIEDEDAEVAVNLLFGDRFSIAYPTEGHGYSAERFSLIGSIEAMKSVFDLAEAVNPNRNEPQPARGDF